MFLKILIIDDVPEMGETQKEEFIRFFSDEKDLYEGKHFIVEVNIKHKDDVLVDENLYPQSSNVQNYANQIIDNYDVVFCDGSFVQGDGAGDDVTGLYFAQFLKNLAMERNVKIYCAVVTGQGEGSAIRAVLKAFGSRFPQAIDMAYSRGEQNQWVCFEKIYDFFYKKRLEFFRRNAPEKLKDKIKEVAVTGNYMDFRFQNYNDIEIEGFDGTLASLFSDIDSMILYDPNLQKKENIQQFIRDHIMVDISEELSMYLNLYGVKAATHHVAHPGRYYNQHGQLLSVHNNNINTSIEQQKERFNNALDSCSRDFREFLRNLYCGKDIIRMIDDRIKHLLSNPIREIDSQLSGYRTEYFQRSLLDNLPGKIYNLFNAVQSENPEMSSIDLNCTGAEGCYHLDDNRECHEEWCAIFFPFEEVFGTELKSMWKKIRKYAYRDGSGEIEFCVKARFVREVDSAKHCKAVIIFRNSGSPFSLDKIGSCGYITNMKEAKFLEYWGDFLISVPGETGTKTVSVLRPDVEVTDQIILENVSNLESGTQYTFVFNFCVPCRE